MDLYCPRCGEPWDNDSLHEEVEERKRAGEEDANYRDVSREFRTKGCGLALRAFTGNTQPCQQVNSNRTAIAAAMADLMGDDMDGFASSMDDADHMGLL